MGIPTPTPGTPNPKIATEPVAFPLRRQYASIQRIIDTGRGFAAQVIGQPGTVYRLSSAVTGDYLQDSSAVLTDFPLFRKIHEGADASMELRETMGLVYYRIIADNNYLEVGDIWYQNDPYYGAGQNMVGYPTDEFVGVCIVHHGVAKPCHGVQVHRFANILRPMAGPDASGFAQSYQQEMAPLYISGGQAVFVQGAQASLIPIGLQPRSRTAGSGQFEKHIPGSTPVVEWHCYIPPIQGYRALEGDILQTYDGARYVVVNPWFEEAGFAGNQVLLKRVNAPVSSRSGFTAVLGG